MPPAGGALASADGGPGRVEIGTSVPILSRASSRLTGFAATARVYGALAIFFSPSKREITTCTLTGVGFGAGLSCAVVATTFDSISTETSVAIFRDRPFIGNSLFI